MVKRKGPPGLEISQVHSMSIGTFNEEHYVIYKWIQAEAYYYSVWTIFHQCSKWYNWHYKARLTFNFQLDLWSSERLKATIWQSHTIREACRKSGMASFQCHGWTSRGHVGAAAHLEWMIMLWFWTFMSGKRSRKLFTYS